MRKLLDESNLDIGGVLVEGRWIKAGCTVVNSFSLKIPLGFYKFFSFHVPQATVWEIDCAQDASLDYGTCIDVDFVRV